MNLAQDRRLASIALIIKLETNDLSVPRRVRAKGLSAIYNSSVPCIESDPIQALGEQMAHEWWHGPDDPRQPA